MTHSPFLETTQKMDTPWEAGGGAGPSALTPPEEWKGATGKDAQQDAQGQAGLQGLPAMLGG